MNSTIIDKNKFVLIKINKKNKNYDLLEQFYNNVCANAFDEHELEDYTNWLNSFRKKNIHTSFIVITLDNKVIGGVVNEIYLRSMCSLISYIAIDENYRRYGLSRLLVEEAIEETKKYNENIKNIFVEVLVPENDVDVQRQKIWKKLNFLPFEFFFQHPGKLKWRYYQLAKYNIDNDKEVQISKKTLLKYFTDFFSDITCEIIAKSDSCDSLSDVPIDDINNYQYVNYYQEMENIKKILEKDDNEYIMSNENLW
jgi:hypothetical protein